MTQPATEATVAALQRMQTVRRRPPYGLTPEEQQDARVLENLPLASPVSPEREAQSQRLHSRRGTGKATS